MITREITLDTPIKAFGVTKSLKSHLESMIRTNTVRDAAGRRVMTDQATVLKAALDALLEVEFGGEILLDEA